jgi:hypothetical protein
LTEERTTDNHTQSIEDRSNAAIGCKTSEVATTLLAQVIRFEIDLSQLGAMSEEKVDALLRRSTAMLAELEPKTATEALLAAQMIGTHQAAMMFITNAMLPEDTAEGRNRNVFRARQLMRMFTEQTEAMTKLKGKSGQQRVVVEHVTVNQGGQAIVGAVAATKALASGGRGGRVDQTVDEPQALRRGWLKNGNPPGDFTMALRCGAKTRRGTSCMGPAMPNGRCRMHGGPSTGPRTPEGLERSRRARWKHGSYSRETRELLAESRQRWRELWELLATEP